MKARPTDPEVKDYYDSHQESIHTFCGLLSYIAGIDQSQRLDVALRHMSLIHNVFELTSIADQLTESDKDILYDRASYYHWHLIAGEYNLENLIAAQKRIGGRVAAIANLYRYTTVINDWETLAKAVSFVEPQEIRPEIISRYYLDIDRHLNIDDLIHAMDSTDNDDTKTKLAMKYVQCLLNGGLERVIGMIPEKDLIRVLRKMDEFVQMKQQEGLDRGISRSNDRVLFRAG